jgi:hypothetical protein
MTDAMNRLRFYEESLKVQARLFLLWMKWNPVTLATPSQDEWAGLGLLIRDDEINPLTLKEIR